MPFPDPRAAAAGAKFKDWRAHGDALAEELAQQGRGTVERLLYHPYMSTDEYAYRSNDGKVSLVNPSGEYAMVPEAEAQSYVDNGWLPESPTKYWQRKQQEEVEGAGFEAFAKGAVSGLTFGASDMLERYGQGSKVLREGEDLYQDPGMTDLERAQAIREAHGAASTLGAVAGSSASLFYGGMSSAAVRAGQSAGRKLAQVTGITSRAERAAAMATRAAERAAAKDAATELALYKNLPTTAAEKEALRLQGQLDEATAGLRSAAEEAATAGATLAEKTTALEAATAPAETALVRWSDHPLAQLDKTQARLHDLLRWSTGPADEAARTAAGLAEKRLAPKEFASAVQNIGLGEAEQAQVVKALKLERDLQNKGKWWDDTIGALDARLKRQDATVTTQEAAQVRRWWNDWKRITDGLSELASTRGVVGQRPQASTVMDDVLASFFRQPGAKALPAAGRATAVAEAQVASKAAGEAVSKVEAAAGLKASLEAELKAAQAEGRMPGFLRTRAGAPRGPVAAPYSASRGEAWLAGEGAPKVSSRAGERWMPEGWTTPSGAPEFPRAREVMPDYRWTQAMETAGGVAARGAVEGGLYAGGRELGSQALAGGDYDPGAVAAQAIEGAAMGSLVSLAGAGISSVAGRAASGIRRAVATKAGVDTTRLEVLLARQRLMMGRLQHTFDEPSREAQIRALRTLKQEIFQARAAVFEKGGEFLKAMSLPLGAATGIGSASIVGMLLGSVGAQGAARILASGIVKRAGVAVATGVGAAVRSSTARAGAKLAGLAIVGSLTEDELRSLKTQLDLTDAKEVGLAALQGYQASGMDPKMSQFFADYQSRRVDILKLAVDNAGTSSTGRVMASRVLNAVEDPRRIRARLSQGEVLTEDLLVLQNLLPEFYRDLSRQAIAMLQKPGLSARERLDLQKIAGNAQYPITTTGIQAALAPVAQEEQPGRKGGGAYKDIAATESQRIQGERA